MIKERKVSDTPGPTRVVCIEKKKLVLPHYYTNDLKSFFFEFFLAFQ